jgi:pyruvate,water dikinase
MEKLDKYILPFSEINMKDIAVVGGKNASLGEMIQHLKYEGVQIPDGFAITSKAYWDFLEANKIKNKLSEVLNSLDLENFSNLAKVSETAKALFLEKEIPSKIQDEIRKSYHTFISEKGDKISLAVRSSATAEDLPNASFAGQQESYLNISGEEELIESCRKCFASLFTERAIKYRIDNGFDHMKVALSVGVQQMIRADIGCSGVAFSIDPDTGFKDIVLIDGIWGLGENLVQGTVDPDEFILFKSSLRTNKKSILSRKLGKKQKTLIYANNGGHKGETGTLNIKTSKEKQEQFILNDQELEKLAKWVMIIEDHYRSPMDVEWAKDGITNDLYILQARPETVHNIKKDQNVYYRYELLERSKILTSGISLGSKIASGKARILIDPKDGDKLQKGEVLVTDVTNPDWDPIMKKAAAIITNKGGRTSHAAIVAREIGIAAVVGCGDATEKIRDGQEITISCADGKKGMIYNGLLKWEKQRIDTSKIKLPDTEVMMILSDPDKAFQYSFLPNNGIGLLRMEFIINNVIQIHPMALVKFNELKDQEAKEKIEQLTQQYSKKEDYFIDLLAQAVGTVAAAFYPKDVIVRMSDFKTNEYANLIGGKQFEPHEGNPMLGFRGASRYYSPLYKEGFKLECEAMMRVRNEMGLTNVKLMIPFCRTVEEGKKVIGLMQEIGLERGEEGLEIYTMIEIPSNIILAEQFAEVFDGFSIGSNDLTQLTLGIDRDSELVSSLFDENNEAVKQLIRQVVNAAKNSGTKIGLCGQAPSDSPEFARFLVDAGIDSISFNPDALIKGINNINEAEAHLIKKEVKILANY